MVYMRRVIHLTALVSFVILLWACLVLPAAYASAQGGSISGKVAFNTGQAVPEGTMVNLVNGSNASEHIPGFNATPDENGFFQFTNVSRGFYRVYAWSPYYAEGYSEGLNVTMNDTYTRSVVLLAMPYYANMTTNTPHVTYGSSADITVQVNDYWGHPVGAGWQILLRSSVGILDPDSAFTDKDGKVYTSLPWVDNAHARRDNGLRHIDQRKLIWTGGEFRVRNAHGDCGAHGKCYSHGKPDDSPRRDHDSHCHAYCHPHGYSDAHACPGLRAHRRPPCAGPGAGV